MTARTAKPLRHCPKCCRMVLMDDMGDLMAKGIDGFVPAVVAVRLPRQHNQAIGGAVVAPVLLAGRNPDFPQNETARKVGGIQAMKLVP